MKEFSGQRVPAFRDVEESWFAAPLGRDNVGTPIDPDVEINLALFLSNAAIRDSGRRRVEVAEAIVSVEEPAVECVGQVACIERVAVYENEDLRRGVQR